MDGVGRDHRAGHAGRVGIEPVGHVTRLQVREAVAVGDQVLQGVDVRRIDGRPVDVGEHAVGDREPHLRAGVARRADAVLACEIEIALVARAPGATDGGEPSRCEASAVDGIMIAVRATTSSATDATQRFIALPHSPAWPAQSPARPLTRAASATVLRQSRVANDQLLPFCRMAGRASWVTMPPGDRDRAPPAPLPPPPPPPSPPPGVLVVSGSATVEIAKRAGAGAHARGDRRVRGR